MNSITAFFDEIDLTKLVPQIDTLLEKLQLIATVALMIGPVIMLIFGLWYFLLPPAEANHKVGFRTWFGMGSVEAWQFTQRLAGIVWGVMGLVLTVVMGIICLTFNPEDVMELATKSFVCLMWQAGLALISYFGISFVVMLRYDGKGYRR